MNRAFFIPLLAIWAVPLACAHTRPAGSNLDWLCYGQGPEHEAQYTGSSQSLSNVHWQAPMDDDPGYYDGLVFAHYASPMITANNTVVYSHRSTTSSGGVTNYNNWSIAGTNGATGSSVFTLGTDYSAPDVFTGNSYIWTSMLPTTLAVINFGKPTQSTAAVVAGAGGSIFVRNSADSETSPTTRLVFYTSLQDYNNNASTYSPIEICTGITADGSNNVYFGYTVTGSVPSNLNLGTGGVAKVNLVTGAATYLSVQSMGVDSSITRPALNGAPALTPNQLGLYIGLTGNNGGFLAKLTVANLKVLNKTRLWDPSIHGAPAQLIDESSAAPMVGPDGHVFYGVFGNQWRESHGWLLQYDQNLNQADPNGKWWPIGAFGWDDTPSIVPASIVPSYTGSSSYLLLCKYNNYDDQPSDFGADGSNKVAVLDPTNDNISRDRQSTIRVMNEILTVLGPTKTNDDSTHPNARREWCINSAAVDLKKKSAIVNSEDGNCYRWDFTTNTLTEKINLQPPTGEAYTSTAIGPDGTIYAMNNTILFAIGN